MRALVLMIVMTCVVSLVRADTVSDAAKDHYEHGQALYAGGHYLEARVEFMAGFDLSHKPAFLFNAAECSRLAGERVAARDAYVRYLQLDPTGKLAPLARQRLAELPPAAPPATPPIDPPPPAAPAPIPAPAVVVANRATATPPPPSTTGTIAVTRTARVEEPSMWHRTGVWIGVGIGVAVVAGSVAIYAATRHGDPCTPPECVVVP
jgi:hypothetical protein